MPTEETKVIFTHIEVIKLLEQTYNIKVKSSKYIGDKKIIEVVIK